MTQDLDTSRRPGPPRERDWGALAAGALALLLAPVAVVVELAASIWGPDSHEGIVTEGWLLVPWFGLPFVALGLTARVVVKAGQRRAEWGTLAFAVAALAGWYAVAVWNTG